MAEGISRRSFLGGMTAAGVTILARSLPTAWAGPSTNAEGLDWERLGPDLMAERLFAPASGALFAASASALVRSDDAGATWREVTLPPDTAGSSRREIQVHPLDHRILFAGGADGLSRSDDDGATWSVVLPGPRRVIRLAASPADPNLLFAGLVNSPSDFWFARSRDGGQSWQDLDEKHNSLCFWNVTILQPHPADPARILRTAGCYAGRDLGDDLEQSLDGGATFSAVLKPELAFPSKLVGGMGEEPGRWYLAANRDGRSGGSSLFTTTDDGASWGEVLQFRGGGTMEQGTTNVRMGGLAYDPSAPHRVFVALNRSLGPDRQNGHQGAGLTMSEDAGATWAELGRQDLPAISDLALGIDGRWLFAATTEGVWRLAL